jgi:flagellar M-ring protein FliF
MDGVLSATVEMQLTDPNRFFIQSQRESRASVIVATTRRLTRAEGTVIARFVSRSVVGLELENIEVVDTNFNVLFSGVEIEDDDSFLPDLQELMVRQRIEVTSRLRDLFTHRFDVVNVAPSLAYSQQFRTMEQVEWSAPIEEMEGGLVLTEHVLNASARGMQPGWEPGMVPNASFIPSYPFGASAEMEASQNEHTRQFALDEMRQIVTDMPSSYIPELSHVSVELIQAVVYCEETLINRNGGRRRDFTRDEFIQLQENTARMTRMDNEEYLQLFRESVHAATGIPLENIRVHAWYVPHFVYFYDEPANVGQILMFVILALLLAAIIFALISRTRPEEDEEFEPELSVEDLLVSTQMEESIEEDYLDPIGYEETNEAKQKLETFIDEKPDAAASLLRHWLNEAEF